MKYATTGDLPPNSKGGAFIHDPKITGEREVKAQVKLAFTNASGNSMICTRAMQLLTKRNSTTFKTLEGQLLAMNHGERVTVSTKCVELDTQVPVFLGVSRAILDYVIFCHQDESLWPLSEPAALKKRFDEIFEALKFTKALDSIKVIRKDLTVELKLLEQSVSHLKSDKERADRTREKLEKTKKLVEEYAQETHVLEQELKVVTEESDKLFKSNQEFQAVISSLETLKHNQRSVADQLERLRSSTRLLPDTNDELQYQLANFESLVKQNSKNLQNLKETFKQDQTDLKEKRDFYSALIREEGALKGNEKQYLNSIAKREELITKSLEQFGFDLDLSSDNILKLFTERLSKSKDTAKIELEEIETLASQQEAELSNDLQTVLDNKLKETQHKEYILKDLMLLTEETEALQTKLKTLQDSEGDLEYEKSTLEMLESKLLEFRENRFVENINNNIKSKNAEISTIENEIENINHEISRSHKQADTNAKISLLREEKSYKEHLLAKSTENLNESLKDNNYGWSIDDKLEFKIDKQLNSLKNESAKLEKEISNNNKKFTQTESSLNYKIKEIDTLSKDLAVSQKKFDQTLKDEQVEDYEEILGEVEDDYNTALENLKLRTTTLDINKMALKVAESKKCCYLCQRNYDDDTELQSFIDFLKSQTKPGAEAELQTKVDEEKKRLLAVRSLSNDVNRVRSTKESLKELELEKNELHKELENLKMQLEKNQQSMKKISLEVSNIESFKPLVQNFNRSSKDFKLIETQLNERIRELENFGISSSTLDELQTTLNEKSTLLKSLRQEINLLLEDKELKQREYSILEGDVKDKRLRISDLEKSTFEKENLIKIVKENKLKIKNLNTTVNKAEEILVKINDKISNISKEIEILKIDNKQKIEIAREVYSNYSNCFQNLEDLNDEIEFFINNDKDSLEKVQFQIKEVSSEISALENKIENTGNLISEQEMKLADSNNEERNLRNNLDIRQLEFEASNIEKEISNIDIKDAEQQRDKYQERSKQMRDKYNELNAQLAGKMGEIKQLEDQGKQIQRDLTIEFQDVDKLYQEEWVKLQTKTIVNDDLNTYSKALDSAIMQYHSLKMQDINRIIDELWKATYSGSDVDTIMIRSDQNTGTKGNRTYNYRVVMIKQDAELDMRGRCSAGQKVLASIIIRLALAECFGTNCGVIALDEPTTNLDSDNIESLGKSLANIIELRRAQKNFQLIVITHDEKFLSFMEASKYTDHFYRIRRNERQKSQIDWVNIHKISE